METNRRGQVAYVYPFAFHYRNDFHERVRAILAERTVDYHFIYCPDPRLDFPRGDLSAPTWATPVGCTSLKIGGTRLRYQHALRLALSKDLVIIQQENSLLLNYAVQVLAHARGAKVAFFGHGRNFQARRSDSAAEAFKRFWSKKADWWFAYTHRSAEIVAKLGFPADRITVFNNAIDTSDIRKQVQALDPNTQTALRQSLCAGSENIGVFVGGLYPEKRLCFLLEAAKLVRAKLPDFHLLIIGGGQDAALVKAAAQELSWVRYVGPKFGAEKTSLVSLAKVFLMPGLVGLAVLDSFAYGTPMVTTDFPYHSPEIDYLKDGQNGLIVENDPVAYAGAVIRVLRDAKLRGALQTGAADSLRLYTIEAMAHRFADGVLKALQV